MRASPAFQVSLSRFGIWHAAVWATCLLAAGGMLAWLVAASTGLNRWPLFVGVPALIVVSMCGIALARVLPMSLRWDGQHWLLDFPGIAGLEPRRGELSVRIDLGAWMLLRFVPEGSRHAAAVVWLPVQRRGLEAQWHGLRCAVYAVRAAPDAVSTNPP